MAYEFTKLSEVTEVTSVSDPKLLVEDGGEIVRIAATEVITGGTTSDGGTTDNTPSTGSTSSTKIYYYQGSAQFADSLGNVVDGMTLYNEFATGTRIVLEGYSGARSEVISVYYTMSTASYYVYCVAVSCAYNGSSDLTTYGAFYSSTAPDPVSTTSITTDDIVLYECSSAGSSTNIGHNMSKTQVTSELNSNKRIMVYYNEDSIGTATTTYKTALCNVISSYTDSEDNVCLVIPYPGSTELRVITLYD